MSLDFNVTKVADHEKVTTAYRWRDKDNAEHVTDELPDPSECDPEAVIRIWHPLTESLVWRTMLVHMGEITEENAAEFYARSKMASRITEQKPMYMDGKPYDFTLEDVKSHIGLTTNVMTLSRNEWIVKVIDYDMESIIRYAER